MSDQQDRNQLNDFDQDQDNLVGQNLFNEINVDGDNDSEQKKLKKLKKAKKDKKSKKQKREKKKKRRHQQQEQYDDYDQEEESRNSMFQDEAESQQQEDIEQEISAEVGAGEEEIYYKEMLNKPSLTRENYFKRLHGKTDKQINAMYSQGANDRRQSEAMYPGENDPKIYIVNVKPRHQDQIVLFLLNKAMHLCEKEERVTIVSAISLKKKYPGKIFVQAFSEKDVRDSLDGFNVVTLSKNLVQLDRQGYAQLFKRKIEKKAEFQLQNFVRVTKGLYEGDLAQIVKIRSNNKTVDVTIVPRLSIQQIAMKIREQTSKIVNDEERSKKMAELLTLFLNHKTNNFKKRPIKQTVSQQELKQQLGDNPAVKKIKLSANPSGLIILNYRFDEITKHQGTFNPVEVMPFHPEGNFIDKINDQKSTLITATSYKKGQQVQIVSGGMMGHWGIINEIVGNVAVITCKNKQLKNQKIEQLVENIMKRFKSGQRVKVISGADTGKTGLVLNVQQKTVEIWTDNQNSIRVNKKNLQVSKTELFNQENVHSLKKDDLIKTSKNQIGIVVQTTKDNIKILDTNNTVQIIGNMDFDSKVNTRNIVAKNRSGDQISSGCTVIIRQGIHESKKCKVIHVYRQNIFLFNATFNRTAGVAVQPAENCSLISKNQPIQSRNYSGKPNQLMTGGEEQFTIGKVIILKTGSLKGYQGIVKGFNKDMVEVRVPSKSCTQWVSRQNIASRQQTMQIGKTPNRKMGNTHNYVPSPSRY